MRVKLTRNIIIKAGTIFDTAPTTTTRTGNHVCREVAFGRDNSGCLSVCLDDPRMSRWFRDAKAPARKRAKKK